METTTTEHTTQTIRAWARAMAHSDQEACVLAGTDAADCRWTAAEHTTALADHLGVPARSIPEELLEAAHHAYVGACS